MRIAAEAPAQSQLRNETFGEQHAKPEEFFGDALYDRRCAFVKKDVAKIGDWIVRDQLGKLSVLGAAAFEREYKRDSTRR